MKAFVFHSSDDLIEIISMDQNPIHIINTALRGFETPEQATVKANHYEVCRIDHYIELHKTKRFFIYS